LFLTESLPFLNVKNMKNAINFVGLARSRSIPAGLEETTDHLRGQHSSIPAASLSVAVYLSV
jgi:hypothetical protein